MRQSKLVTNNAGKENEECQKLVVRLAFPFKLVREVLSDKVTFEQSPEGGEGKGLQITGRSFLGSRYMGGSLRSSNEDIEPGAR